MVHSVRAPAPVRKKRRPAAAPRAKAARGRPRTTAAAPRPPAAVALPTYPPAAQQPRWEDQVVGWSGSPMPMQPICWHPPSAAVGCCLAAVDMIGNG